jgi:hypothetical protein
MTVTRTDAAEMRILETLPQPGGGRQLLPIERTTDQSAQHIDASIGMGTAAMDRTTTGPGRTKARARPALEHRC